MSRVFALVLCSAVALCAFGCSGGGKGLKTEYVEGVVTLDGVPQDKVTVNFMPVGTTGESASGYTDAKGVYKLSSANGNPEKGALMGEYKITVSKTNVTEFTEEEAEKDERGISILSKVEQLFPIQYTKADQTPLSYTVIKGRQKHNIELTSQ